MAYKPWVTCVDHSQWYKLLSVYPLTFIAQTLIRFPDFRSNHEIKFSDINQASRFTFQIIRYRMQQVRQGRLRG